MIADATFGVVLPVPKNSLKAARFVSLILWFGESQAWLLLHYRYSIQLNNNSSVKTKKWINIFCAHPSWHLNNSLIWLFEASNRLALRPESWIQILNFISLTNKPSTSCQHSHAHTHTYIYNILYCASHIIFLYEIKNIQFRCKRQGQPGKTSNQRVQILCSFTQG